MTSEVTVRVYKSPDNFYVGTLKGNTQGRCIGWLFRTLAKSNYVDLLQRAR